MEDDTNTDHSPGHAGEEAELVDVVTQSHSPGHGPDLGESQVEGGHRHRPQLRTRAGGGRGGGGCHWVPQPGIHGPARVQISAMLRLKVMRSPVN